jgi:hypothetical protein
LGVKVHAEHGQTCSGNQVQPAIIIVDEVDRKRDHRCRNKGYTDADFYWEIRDNACSLGELDLNNFDSRSSRLGRYYTTDQSVLFTAEIVVMSKVVPIQREIEDQIL